MLLKYLNNYLLRRGYIKHNNNFFKKCIYTENIFLVEFNGWQAMHIVFSYLANYFSEKKNCKIVAFESYNLLQQEKNKFFKKLKWHLGIFFKIKNFAVYDSFGTSSFLEIKYKDSVIIKSTEKLKYIYNKGFSLKKLENLRLENIWIGDLIYDSYLKKFSKYTVDINSEVFKNFFLDCLKNFYFWFDFFKKNKVKGIVVGHAVYISGIPLRVANFKKIPNFNFYGLSITNGANSILYKKKQNNADIHFRYFRKIFRNFKKIDIKKNLNKGKYYLNRVIKGETKYYYMKKSSFSKKIYNLKNFHHNKKIKVVIYAHQFADSPHIFGNHFFPDFYEWFKFLEKVIKKTDYDWFMKPHPNQEELTKKTVEMFIKRNPKVTLLPTSVSNLYLIKKKINFALTVYGTIASELPFFGIKVINASKNNPHFNYNFSINPKNIFEYDKILTNLKTNKFKINIKDLYEFHYMKQHYQLQTSNSFFSDAQEYFRIDKESSRAICWTNKCYKIWLDSFSEKYHKKIKNMLANFINSGNYMIFPSDK
jgi:hypothetical protein